MNNNNNIGLVIWGCKAGHRVICSNGMVDPTAEELKSSVKDTRMFQRFYRTHTDIYALAFVRSYKIYTKFRSCNDNGTGAYVAFSIYVPHSLKISNVRELLDRMIDSYFQEYIHPLSGTYYPGKYDDIQPFNRILEEARISRTRGKCIVDPAASTDCPRVVLYNDVAEIDQYLSDPYRREFMGQLGVQFISKDVYSSTPSLIDFTRKPEILTKVSAPVDYPRLVVEKNSDENIEISVNGVKVYPSDNPDEIVQLDDNDRLDYRITRRLYKEIRGAATVATLKSPRYGILTLRNSEMIFRIPPSMFQPEIFRFIFTVNGGMIPFGTEISADGKHYKPLANIYDSSLIGKTSTPRWRMAPFERCPVKIEAKNPINLVDAVNNSNKVDLATEEFIFKICSDSSLGKALTISIENGNPSGAKFTVPISNNRLDFNSETIKFSLPANDYKKENFSFEMDGYDVNGVNLMTNTITVTKKLAKVISDKPKTTDHQQSVPGGRPMSGESSSPGESTEKSRRIEGGGQTNDHSGIMTGGNIWGDTNEPIKTVELRGCQGLVISNKKIESDFFTYKVKKDEKIIRLSTPSSKSGPLCQIYTSKSKYYADGANELRQRNVKNGFIVDYCGQTCSIFREKKESPLVRLLRNPMTMVTLFAVVLVFTLFIIFKPFISNLIDSDKEPMLTIVVLPDSISRKLSLDSISLDPKDKDGIKCSGDSIQIFAKDAKDLEEKLNEFSVKVKWTEDYDEDLKLSSFRIDPNAVLDEFNQNDKKTVIKEEQIQPEKAMNAYHTTIENITNPIDFYKQASEFYKFYKVFKSHFTDSCYKLAEKAQNWGDYKKNLDVELQKKIPDNTQQSVQLNYTDGVSPTSEISIQKPQSVGKSKEEIKKAEKQQIEKLHGNNCTSATVAEVKKWYNSLSPEEKKQTHIQEYIRAYEGFFNAKSLDDITKLNGRQNYFSKGQQNLIWIGYGKNQKEFKLRYKSRGMRF